MHLKTTMRQKPILLRSPLWKKVSIDKDREKLEPLYGASGVLNGATIMRNNMYVPPKNKIELPYDKKKTSLFSTHSKELKRGS